MRVFDQIMRLLPAAPRTRAISSVMFIAVITLVYLIYLWWIGYTFPVDDFHGAFVVSWVAGFILFVCAVFVTIITLTDENGLDFIERAKILFKGSHDPHIKYILEKIANIEHYSEETVREIKIKKFHEETNKFYVETHTKMRLRSYIPDAPSTFQSPLAFDVEPAPAGAVSSKLAYLRVDGISIMDSTLIEGTNFITSYSVSVPKGRSVDVSFGIYSWVSGGGKPNLRYTPRRFTRKLKVLVENDVHDKTIVVFHQGGEEKLHSGDIKTIFEREEILPDRLFYEISLVTASAA